MNKMFLALAAAALLFSPIAKAADMPVKAATVPAYLQYPLGSGFFYGGNASGFAGTTGSTGGLTSGNLIGAKVGLDVGYTGVIGSGFWFIEQNFNAQAIQGPGNGLSVSAQFGMEQRYAYGVSQDIAAKLVSWIPGLNSIAMPSVPTISGVTFGPANYYVFAATYEDDVSASIGTATGKSWLFSYGVGTGIIWRSNKLFVFDTSIEWKHSESGLLVGSSPSGLVKPFSDAFLATGRIKF